MSKNHESNSTNTTTRSAKTESKTAKASTAGETKIHEAGEKEFEQGYRGALVDPTENHAYTVAGVTSGAPTPETDYDHAVKTRVAVTRPEAVINGNHPAQKAMQEAADAESAQGFRGTRVDNTENANYSVAGVTANAPTPETDAAAAKAVREETNHGLSGIEQAHNEKANAEKLANDRRVKRGQEAK